jgi:hypothetical protein
MTDRELTFDEAEAAGFDGTLRTPSGGKPVGVPHTTADLGPTWTGTDSYTDACQAAATHQGLDAATQRLTAERITHEVEQTGGFCMVLVIPVGDGHVCVTYEPLDADHNPDGAPPWFTCHYPHGDWRTDMRDTYTIDECHNLSLDGLVAFVRQTQAEVSV